MKGFSMEEVDNQFGKNLKILRESIGETQLELALYLDFKTSSTVANYEKGERQPSPYIIKKIANHYRITENMLISSDLSNLRKDMLNIDFSSIPIEKLTDITKKIFPIIGSKTALENNDFKRGYQEHKKMYKLMNVDYQLEGLDFDLIIDSYDNASKAGIRDGWINIYIFLIQIEAAIKNPWMKRMSDEILVGSSKLNKDKFFKHYYLKDTELNEESIPEEDRELIEDLDELYKEVYSELRPYNEFADLMYYLTALRYIYGCVGEQEEQPQNSIVGVEMIYAYARMGNTYAKRYLKVLLKFLK